MSTTVSPPTGAEGTFGQSAYNYAYTFGIAASISDGGPNKGYQYVSAFTDSSTYIYELNPGLTNSADPFYQHQYGQCGFPSVAQIIAAVQAHEYSGSQSHYSEVAAFLAGTNQTTDPSKVAEQIIANPSQGQITSTTVQDAVNPLYLNIQSAGNPEPPVNLPANINYSPYQPLPPGCQ